MSVAVTVLLSILIGLATIVAIVYPLFSDKGKKKPSQAKDSTENQQELLAQKEVAYSVIREAEFDHETGSLSEEELGNIRVKYQRKAESLARDTAGPQRLRKSPKDKSKIDDAIEQEIRKLRQDRSKQDKPKARACPRCGAKQQSGAKFCSRCGAKQPKGETR